jgi:hypothetical protein
VHFVGVVSQLQSIEVKTERELSVIFLSWKYLISICKRCFKMNGSNTIYVILLTGAVKTIK